MFQLISHDVVVDLCVLFLFFQVRQQFFLVFNPSFTVMEVGFVRRLNGLEPEENESWQAIPHFFSIYWSRIRQYYTGIQISYESDIVYLHIQTDTGLLADITDVG